MRTLRTIFIIIPMALSTFALGWGYDVHRRINQKAAEIIEGEFGLYTQSRAYELALYAPIADFIKEIHSSEFNRHFIDADYYDEFPFPELNVTYDQLLENFGQENLNDWGIAPWSIDETAKTLTKMFKEERWNEALYYMGHLGHYVADLHMPLHTCANYNGQFTGNEGIHFRWESRMVDKLIPNFEPKGEIQKINDRIAKSLEITRESFQLYPRLLEADNIARKHLSFVQAKELNTYKTLHYEDRYLKLLYAETEDVVHDRLGKAAVMVASFWYSCWVDAGSPTPPK